MTSLHFTLLSCQSNAGNKKLEKAGKSSKKSKYFSKIAGNSTNQSTQYTTRE